MIGRLKKYLALLFLLIVLGGCNGASPAGSIRQTPTPYAVPANALIVKNGTVIDGTGAAPLHNGVAVIVNDKIVSVGRAVDFAIAPDVKFIDAKGGTILPGVINAHVHETGSALVRQFYFLEHGVTSTCDLGGAVASMASHQSHQGYRSAARGFYSGPIINVPEGYPGTREFLYEVTTPDEARRAVTDLVNRGADYIKVAFEPNNSKLPWETPPTETIPNLDMPLTQAIVEQAHAYGRRVRAHLGTAAMLDFALDGGVDVIEHVPLPPLSDIDFQARENGLPKLSEQYKAQLARMVKQRVALVPTLDRVIPWCQGWAITPERKQLCVGYALAPVAHFHQLGGIVALGDDSGYQARTLMPVAEMRWLLAAGMTPLEIIQAGTQSAARVCGHGDELGTLEPGKLADVIVVDGDPLSDLDVMNRVTTVIIGGQIVVPR